MIANTTFLLMYDEKNIYVAANYRLAVIMCRNRTVQEALRNFLNVNRQLLSEVTICVEN